MRAHFKYTDEQIIDIYKNDYLENHIGCTTLEKMYGVDFYKDFQRLGLQRRNDREKSQKYICDSNYFKTIDTEEKAYWLGFVYGDGYISNPKSNTIRFGLSIGIIDLEHMRKFKKAINSTHPIKTYSVTQGYKIGTEYCRIIIIDEKFIQNLESHGVVEHKSNIMEPPIGVPDNYIRHFIRGFMDANGSITIANTPVPTFGIGFTSTDTMLDWIQDNLFKNGAINRKYPLTKRKKNHIVSAFSFGGNYQVKQYLDYIYEDATVWLDRKYERYQLLCEILKDREKG